MSRFHRCAARRSRRPARRPGTGLSVSQWVEPAHPADGGAGPQAVVEVVGDVDVVTARHLLSALGRAIRFNQRVCCDLSAVGYFGAAGADVLAVVHVEAAGARRRFSVRGVRGQTAQVLEATGLAAMLTVIP